MIGFNPHFHETPKGLGVLYYLSSFILSRDIGHVIVNVVALAPARIKEGYKPGSLRSHR